MGVQTNLSSSQAKSSSWKSRDNPYFVGSTFVFFFYVYLNYLFFVLDWPTPCTASAFYPTFYGPARGAKRASGAESEAETEPRDMETNRTMLHKSLHNAT